MAWIWLDFGFHLDSDWIFVIFWGRFRLDLAWLGFAWIWLDFNLLWLDFGWIWLGWLFLGFGFGLISIGFGLMSAGFWFEFLRILAHYSSNSFHSSLGSPRKS